MSQLTINAVPISVQGHRKRSMNMQVLLSAQRADGSQLPFTEPHALKAAFVPWDGLADYPKIVLGQAVPLEALDQTYALVLFTTPIGNYGPPSGKQLIVLDLRSGDEHGTGSFWIDVPATPANGRTSSKATKKVRRTPARR